MSYYGKAHRAYDYYRASTDDMGYYASASRDALPAYAREYYSVSIALDNYLAAYRNSTDREMKARCLFMAAKCWQKSAKLPETAKGQSSYWLYGSTDYYGYSIKCPYFTDLLKYKDTKFFTSAYNTCSYFKDYVKRDKW